MPIHVLIVSPVVIPAKNYGGIQRSIGWLGKALVRLGHKVTYLVGQGSHCDFADVLTLDSSRPIDEQIPEHIDIVHFQYRIQNPPEHKPYLATVRNNSNSSAPYDLNTVFISRNHAQRHGSEVFVYNCIDPDDYGTPDWNRRREYLHFLAKAAWRLKNVKGAIEIARQSHEKLRVLGGYRLNFNMGFRFTPDLHVRFHGMVDGPEKFGLINSSKALLFPVLWHEPFGLALIESLYFGCPVFGTPYGSLPEIVVPEAGFLSAKKEELVRAIANVDSYNRKWCHEYVCDTFNSTNKARGYLALYEKVLSGAHINEAPPRLQESDTPKFLPFY